ncbi:AraC family transcriptional regulator [Ferrimonas aestuarii]|uniref:AraC family transcriptional regulator n=1 Tax=Ferrimonas aestuarii TaxID=2569539 RepID=A0A4U1BRG4_9GAMM|nr:AraC family transcriptional regulator [Ferrimonas aestuarii]TKB55514.1 AraC family transcriptional regulator [Ferrimonas aestuarii]
MTKKYLSHLLKLELDIFGREVEESTLLDGTGLERDFFTDPYFMVDESQVNRFHKNLLQSIDPKLAGIKVGKALKLYNFGPFGQLLMSSKNTDQTNGYKELSERLFYLPLEVNHDADSKFIYKTVVADKGDTSYYRFNVERGLSFLYRTVSILCPEASQPSWICLDAKENDDKQALEAHFGCEVRFNHPKPMIVYPKLENGRNIRNPDSRVNNAMLSLVESLIDEMKCQGNIESEVRKLLKECQGDFPSLSDIAVVLRMSERTLSRKLKEEACSYQHLLDDVRKLKAIDYLRQGNKTVQVVSDLCGFTDVKSFGRSFKRWTGKCPSEYKGK